MFKFSYRPPELFSRGKFLPKITIFWRFLVPHGHSFKVRTVKFRMTVRSWGSLPQAKLCKNRPKGIYPFGANVYHKLAFLAIFWAVSPHLLSQNGKIWRDLGNRPQAKFCKNLLKGVYPFGQIYIKNTNFGDFGCCTPTFLTQSD